MLLLRNAQNTIATGIRKALYSLAEAEQRMGELNGSTARSQGKLHGRKKSS